MAPRWSTNMMTLRSVIRNANSGILVTLLLFFADFTKSFGTLEKPFLLNQHSEHEHITRAAYRCRTGELVAEGNCFEPRSLDQIAGHAGTLGAVGAPDSLTLTPEGPEAHCDEADYLDIPNYPQSRDAATQALQSCVNHLHARFKQGITYSAQILDPFSKKIRPEMVDLTNNLDDSLRDCTFAFTTPFPGVGRGKCSAIEGLGRALHGVQDFYSHSNWADRSRAGEPISDVNPPGLGLTVLTDFFEFTSSSPLPVVEIDRHLSTGCFDGFASDETPGRDRCYKRVSHHTLNKDHAVIDEDGLATLPTHLTLGGTTPRSEIPGNLQSAVDLAVKDTKRQWTLFKENLRTEYGSEEGNSIICALTRDTPLRSCYGRRIALVIGSARSGVVKDPENLRIATARQLVAKLTTRAQATLRELPDKLAIINFDSSTRIISPLSDPEFATFKSIDSLEGTDVTSGMKLGIVELIKTQSPTSDRYPFTQYEEQKAGLVILTDAEDPSASGQIAQLKRAAELKIRVSYGYLAASSDPLTVPTGELELCKRVIDTEILEAILKTGGLFATIDSATAQHNFVQMVFNRGITGINGGPSDAIELLPGLTLYRLISTVLSSETFYCKSYSSERLRLTVSDVSSQSLHIIITDVCDGSVVTSGATDIPNVVLTFDFNPTSKKIYRITVSSSKGTGSGVYSIGLSLWRTQSKI